MIVQKAEYALTLGNDVEREEGEEGSASDSE